MADRARNQKPRKKQLSIFELRALADEHKESPVFVTNPDGERALEPWLKELRFRQAWQAAEWILGEEIEQPEFEGCWARTPSPIIPKPKKPRPPKLPNTATFGGYRLRNRTALDRRGRLKAMGKRQKKRRW
jgi:hypothetical protein